MEKVAALAVALDTTADYLLGLSDDYNRHREKNDENLNPM